jgi:hypothetical protein
LFQEVQGIIVCEIKMYRRNRDIVVLDGLNVCILAMFPEGSSPADPVVFFAMGVERLLN